MLGIRERILRVLSRIFRCFCVAVGLAFATLPAMSAYDMGSCTDDGFVWDSTNQRCCWHYYVINDRESICINENNFSSYFSGLGCQYAEAALYIDANGEPQCCPAGTVPDNQTHSCVCENGGWFDGGTGQCRLFTLARSTFCDEWDKENRDQFGYFFDYLLGGRLGSLTVYRSKHTCTAVISKMNQVGLSDVVTGVEDSCVCKCVDPMLSFNPSAAADCVDGDGAACQNVCVDASGGQNSACPLGQQKYLVNDEWTCCIFYDPNSGTCIQNVSEWRQYISSLEFDSGGGYVNAEGVPVECPVGDEVVVNSETGMCACRSGGWFDVTTGTCMKQLKVRYTYRRSAGAERTYNYTQTGTGAPATQTANGYLDTFFHQVYNPNGAYVYTSLPVTNMSTTPYVYTTTSSSFPGRVESFYYVTLTFMGNGGTFSGGATSDLKNIRVGSYSVAAQTPTRSGYTFNGWWTSATGGTQVTSANLTDVTADTIYYAHWTQSTPTTSTITLNKNDGTGTCGGVSGTNNGSITCTVGGNCTLPSWNASTCNLTKSGNKIFVGWTTTAPANHTSSTTGTTGSISSPASNTTYYAVWKDTTCSVTNGTGSATTPSNNAPRCVVTCNTGYQTSGTYTSDTPGDPVFDTGQCSARAVRVLANDSNGNTYGAWVSCAYGGTCTLQSGDVFSAPSGSSGFGKWLCRIGLHNASGTTCGNFTSGQTLTVAQSNALVLADTEVERTLYACWNYGITYNLNSGTAATTASSRPTSYNHCDGATIGGTAAASKPTRTGYTFAGWCDDAELTSNCNVTRTISAGTTGAKTYYAKWTQDTVTIVLDANHNTSGSCTASVTCNVGDTCTLPSWDSSTCNITKGTGADSKIFVGWSTLNDGTSGTYSITAPSSSTTYYAVWATPTCTVSNGTGTITTPLNNAPRCVVACNTGYQTSGTYTGTAGGTSVSYTCGAKTYTVTLNANGPSLSDRSFYEVYGTRWKNTAGGTITTIPAWSWTGHVLQGYYTAATGGDLIIPSSHALPAPTVIDDVNAPDGTITLYAQWGSECGAGTYMVDNECVDCPPGQSCAGGSAQPVDCTGNTYATGGASSCSNCPTGYVVAGTGTTYHDESCDCGRILHVGTYSLHLRSCKKTTPSLNFDFDKDGEADLFGNMTTTVKNMSSSNTKKFKTKYNNTTYYVCDDTICNDE